MDYSQMSMLEVAIAILEAHEGKMKIVDLIASTLEAKNISDTESELATQLYLDITTSSKFVFMGDEEWDLKSRQPIKNYDKDGSEFVVETDIEDAEDDDAIGGFEDINDTEDFADEMESEDENDDEDDSEYEEDDDSDDYERDDDGHILDRYNEESDDFDEDEYNDYMDDFEDMYDDN